jgi:hypothetical protein
MKPERKGANLYNLWEAGGHHREQAIELAGVMGGHYQRLIGEARRHQGQLKRLDDIQQGLAALGMKFPRIGKLWLKHQRSLKKSLDALAELP